MALKNKTHDIERAAVVQRTSKPAVRTENEYEQVSPPVSALGRIVTKPPAALRPTDILTLQRTVGNRAVQRMLSSQHRSLPSLPSTAAPTIQRETEEEEPLQRKSDASVRAENKTGLPDLLKTGIENLSGLSLDDVRVHRNSPRPAELQALAYTQGTDIHLGPDEEEHLPHEAWHVVQQKQGRVRPTLQMKSVAINDDAGLEKEADVMGARAAATVTGAELTVQQGTVMKRELNGSGSTPIQRKVGFEFETSWAIEKPSDVAWGTNSQLVTGTGWQLSPDELKGDSAVIEFKTEPYEIEGADTKELSKPITASFKNFKTYGDKLVALEKDKKVALPEAKSAFKDVQVTPKEDKLAAKPQVTGGVREDLILDFLGHTTKEKEQTLGAELMPGEGRKGPMIEAGKIALGKIDKDSAKDRKYAGTVTLLAFYLRRAYQWHEAIMTEVREWSKEYIKAMNAADPTKKEKMRDAFNAAKMEEMKKRAPSYAKGIASVLPRIRFSKLPEISRPSLLKDVTEAAGMEEYEKGKQAWPTGLKSFDNVWGSADITIENWIKSIQAEKPSLSLAKAQFWGEREIEAGDVGVGEKKGAGILFELRGQESGLTYDNYFEYAKPYLEYFRKLNERDKPSKD